MNYEKIYNQIIQRAQNENRKKGEGIYYEEHHIIPRCMGGEDIQPNKVLLTGKEHYVSHRLLSEMFPDNTKLKYAYKMMAFMTGSEKNERDYRISSFEYNRLKEFAANEMSQRTKGKVSARKGKHLTEEHKKRIGEANSGKSGRKHTEATKKKISHSTSGEKNSFYGKTHSLESRLKISNSMRGRIPWNKGKTGYMSESGKQNIIKATKKRIGIRRKVIKCPHCNKIGGIGGMHRWHFDNCKFKPKS